MSTQPKDRSSDIGKNGGIKYINPEIPDVEFPKYSGERYEATVPDTLDLQERARLAINALTEVTDPEADYEIYWLIYFNTKPASMIHNCWQSSGFGKFMWALSLLRLVSGSEQNLHVEHRWKEVALKSQGPDGLIYSPVQGRPWAYDGISPEVKTDGDQFLCPFGNATMMSAMAHFTKLNNGSLWQDALQRLVDGVIDLAVDAGNYAYFWPSFIRAEKERPADAAMPTRPFGSESSVTPHALVHAYRVLGYEPALRLAYKFINYLRKNFYAQDGSFLSSAGNFRRAHFHAHARGLLAMQEYAETADDQELMEFVVSGFKWARDLGVNLKMPIDPGLMDHYDTVKTPGSDLIGFFPEWTNSPEWQTSEMCPVTDMIALALRLSEAGVGDYWDDADRWIRNMLAGGQLRSVDWVYPLSEKGTPVVGSSSRSVDRVPERNLGAFAGAPSANDWYAKEITPATAHIMGHCCLANGSKVLYWIWERILRYQDGTPCFKKVTHFVAESVN